MFNLYDAIRSSTIHEAATMLADCASLSRKLKSGLHGTAAWSCLSSIESLHRDVCSANDSKLSSDALDRWFWSIVAISISDVVEDDLAPWEIANSRLATWIHSHDVTTESQLGALIIAAVDALKDAVTVADGRVYDDDDDLWSYHPCDLQRWRDYDYSVYRDDRVTESL